MPTDGLFQRALIARRYYLDGRTRVEIAEEFGLSRFKVARILEEAVESGTVQIRIHYPGSIDADLSTALRDRFGLAHAYAVDADSNRPSERIEAVAKTAADLVQSILRTGDVIGVDCGRTLAHIVGYIDELPPCDVVQLTGMAGPISGNGADIVRRLTEITGGGSWPLYAPMVVPDARTAAGLMADQQIQRTLRHHDEVTCAIVSIGAWQPEASQVYPLLPDDEARALRDGGVRAETCALLLDENGRRLPGLDDRRMGIDEAVLRRIPTVIAVAAGAEKIEATTAVLRSGLVSSLITDVGLAAAVLD